MDASIDHDCLYVAWQMQNIAPTDNMRLFSDRVVLLSMLESGMGCKAYTIN